MFVGLKKDVNFSYRVNDIFCTDSPVAYKCINKLPRISVAGEVQHHALNAPHKDISLLYL